MNFHLNEHRRNERKPWVHRLHRCCRERETREETRNSEEIYRNFIKEKQAKSKEISHKNHTIIPQSPQQPAPSLSLSRLAGALSLSNQLCRALYLSTVRGHPTSPLSLS